MRAVEGRFVISSRVIEESSTAKVTYEQTSKSLQGNHVTIHYGGGVEGGP